MLARSEAIILCERFLRTLDITYLYRVLLHTTSLEIGYFCLTSYFLLQYNDLICMLTTLHNKVNTDMILVSSGSYKM